MWSDNGLYGKMDQYMHINGQRWTGFRLYGHCFVFDSQGDVHLSKVSIIYFYFPFQNLVSFGIFAFARNIVL